MLLSALLLLIVFRSLVIPVQAALMNLLDRASLGVIVAVFQHGWLGGLFGVEPGPIDSFIPVMLFAIVFGLSMDYEVFLMSRIHEEWTHGREATPAVRYGLAATSRVITAAATIMVCVFLSFVLIDERVVKMFGVSLAAAVFLDAFVVRSLLVPAARWAARARDMDAALVDGAPVATPGDRAAGAPGGGAGGGLGVDAPGVTPRPRRRRAQPAS